MKEHHLSVARTARYHTLGNSDAPDEVWFVCHGYGQLAADFLRLTAVLDNGNRFIVAPEALSRFYRDGAGGKVGASWMTKADRKTEIDDYVAFLDALYDHVFQRVDRENVTVHVLGFSQGVATVSRWICRGAARADFMVLWGELLPPELNSEASLRKLIGTRITLVCGERDEYIKPAHMKELRARLRRYGMPFVETTFKGGHRMDQETLKAIAESQKAPRDAPEEGAGGTGAEETKVG